MSVAKAQNYYYDRDCLYQQSDSRYIGTGAATLGLEGKSIGEEFALIIRGFTPDGEKVAQRKNLDDKKAVAGLDIVFTLPKSWSVLALVDPRLKEAHLEAARETMAWIEAQGWVLGRETVNGITSACVGKMVGMVAPHGTSRDNDAHIHAHGFIANTVERPDGTYSTLKNDLIFKHSKDIRQYQLSAFMAKEAVKEYGVELSVDRGGTVVPEAAGVPNEVKELFSKRHNEIHSADKLRERLQEKMPHLGKDALETLVQLGTRSAKNKDLTEADLLKSHREQLQAAGLPSLEQLRDNALSLKAVQEQSAEKLTAAEYVKQAAEDLSEHQSVFSKAELLQGALKQSIGHATPNQIEKAILEVVGSREVVSYGDDKFTTPEIHKIEGQVAKVAVEQREVFVPVLHDNQVQDVVRTFEEKKGFTLTKGQAEAVGYVLQHTGRIGVIQGDAGAGKSSSMEAVADAIKEIGQEQGVQVRGFALQGKTSVLLEGDSGISSGTLDSFLNSKSQWNGADRQIWIVDEYSMVDSRRLGALVERAESENAQVFLLGDKKQLAAISAGRLGQDLDEHKLVKTVQLDESLRQKTEYAKAIDAAMKHGDVRTALEVMEKAGKLHVIANQGERTAAMARAFVQADAEAREATGGRKGALAMTLTNAEREAVIKEVRVIQKEQGIIAREDHSFTTRAPVQLDAVTRKLAASYRPGMIAIPSKQIGELQPGQEARVMAIDTVKNTITLAGADGKQEIVDARKNSKGLMVYEERKTQLSVGEKIIWLKSDNSKQGKFNRIKNGLSGTIEKIDGGLLTVKTELGHSVQIQAEGAYITNAQAITGHKSQGATEHTGLLSISAGDRLATQNMLYVLTTRQTDDLVAFVDDKEKLIDVLRAETKTSSLEQQQELLKSLMVELKQSLQEGKQATESLDEMLGVKNERGADRQRQAEIENSNLPTNELKQQQSSHHEQQQDHGAMLSL